jgi:hypothetical protein
LTTIPQNIIQSHTLNIHFTGMIAEAAARSEAEDMNRLFLERLEKLFDKYDKADKMLIVEALSVEVSCASTVNWKTEALSLIMANVENTLQQKTVAVKTIPAHSHKTENALQQENVADKVIPTHLHSIEVLQFYLVHGYLPWWEAGITALVAASSLANVFVPAVLKAPAANLKLLLDILANNNAAAHRFSDLFHEADFRSWMQYITGELFGDKHFAAVWEQDMALLLAGMRNDFDKNNLKKYYRLLLLQLFGQHQNMERIDKIFKEKINAHLYPDTKLPEKNRSENSIRTDTVKASSVRKLTVHNAGVVILAPFLPQAFEQTGIAEQGAVVHGHRALALLHYLVTGNTEFHEYETVLYKVLLGVEPEIYIDCSYRLLPEEKTEADNLLRAVIAHWSALKATSIEGLRGSFLCREGKLSQDEEGTCWQLTVVEQAYDLLLHRLPWTIGMIKLPWMNKILKTEWV